MTKEEAIQFVAREHQILECSFSPVYPHFDFRWDDEAEIILLDISNRKGEVLKTHAIGFEGVDSNWLYHKVHRAIETFMTVHPDWTDLRVLDDTGLISWEAA